MANPDLIALTRKLIDVPSVTGEEREVGALLERELRNRGFDPRVQRVGQGRHNVYVLPADAEVVLCTHMDTVGPFIPSSEDDLHVWGRGACDAKGIMAAMIVAAERLARDGRAPGLLFVVGEETDSAGAKAANTLAPAARYIVVGEPTDGRLASGHKGMLAFELEATGEAAHSAYPHLGDSAVHRLLDALTRIRAHDWGNDPVLGEASVNVGRIEGGVAMNVVAPSARATVAIRLVGAAEEATAQLTSLVDDERLTVRIISQSSAVHCVTVDDFPSTPVAFGSDLFYLDGWGQPLLMGPGSIHVAHRDDERIEKRALSDAVDDYVRLVERLQDS